MHIICHRAFNVELTIVSLIYIVYWTQRDYISLLPSSCATMYCSRVKVFRLNLISDDKRYRLQGTVILFIEKLAKSKAFCY
jgi:hypothetical protein